MKKTLSYIDVMYDEETEWLLPSMETADLPENQRTLVCLNAPMNDEKSFIINFGYFFKSSYKRMVYINFQNLRQICSINYYNTFQSILRAFDEIWDFSDTDISDWRPENQDRVFKSPHLFLFSKETLEEIHNKWRDKEITFNFPGQVEGKFHSMKRWPNTQIGEFVGCRNLSTYHCGPSDMERLEIGDFTSIGEETKIMRGRMHPKNRVTQYFLRYKHKNYPEPYEVFYKGDFKIGCDVWIGSRCIILGGADIGHGAIIGAGAVVTGKIPAYAIACGVPARIVGWRFPKWQRDALLKISWWNWPIWKIYDNLDKLESEDITAFIDEFREDKPGILEKIQRILTKNKS